MKSKSGTTRGRHARSPREIPGPGWRDILLRVNREMSRGYLGLVAAGIAFYFIMAIVPTLTATISIYGLMANPQTVVTQIEALSEALPDAAAAIIRDQLLSISQAPSAGLGLGAVISILFALWAASTGMRGLIMGINIAYDETEKRGFIALYLVIFAFTIGAILFLIATALLLAVLPIVAALLLPESLAALVDWVRWPVLLVLLMFALAVTYRFAPSRHQARWRWVSVGAVFAAFGWLLGSVFFSLYVANFANYNETYGSLGAIVILMMWFWISAFMIVLGGALNAEVEHQTARDSTVGPDRPMGRREATKADHLGAPLGRRG